MSGQELLIIGNISDHPLALDLGHYSGQRVDISDLISLKDFQNTEFCPRFISDESDLEKIGQHLDGKRVTIVSTSVPTDTRNSLAMRNLIIARAAKDNGAKEVVLMEPDLFYSCQDRGPREEHSFFDEKREPKDRKKFDGQPFTAYLYAQLLKLAGVDRVVTIHNHSHSTQEIFKEMYNGQFHDLIPNRVFGTYLEKSGIVDFDNLVLCAPDKGATPFVDLIEESMSAGPVVLRMDKERSGERSIAMVPSANSDIPIEGVEGKDVVVFDDMVRTGTTIVKCCRLIKKHKPRRVIFCVTHFHSSPESRENLNDDSIDEIVTTNTIPSILNRDTQGRLRKKMVVLKLEKWISQFLTGIGDGSHATIDEGDLFSVDMSSKNPRWCPDIARSFQK